MSAADESKAGLEDERPASGPYSQDAMSEARMAALAKGRAKRDETVAKIREARDNGELSRYQLYLRGELQVSDMDDDELSRGVFRNLGGTFMSTQKQVFTAKAHADMKRILLQRGQKKLDAAYQDAIETLVGISKSDAAEDKDRIKAALAIMERVAGKVPDRIEVGGTDAFSDVLAGIIDDSVREDKPAAVSGEDA